MQTEEGDICPHVFRVDEDTGCEGTVCAHSDSLRKGKGSGHASQRKHSNLILKVSGNFLPEEEREVEGWDFQAKHDHYSDLESGAHREEGEKAKRPEAVEYCGLGIQAEKGRVESRLGRSLV